MSYQYRDSTALAQWVKLSLYAQIAISLIAIASGYFEYQMLQEFRQGIYESQQAAMSAAEASDRRQSIIGIVQVVIAIVSGFLILRWIHRSNWNARACGAKGMQFTPGWSIGWYFVPIMNLWKPFHAMQEIWKASSTSKDRQTQEAPSSVMLWWVLWLIYSMLGNIAYRMTAKANALPDYINASLVTLLSDTATLPLCLVFLPLMLEIQARLSEKYALSKSADLIQA